GSVDFNFSQMVNFAQHKKAVRGGDISFNGIYALNAKTGQTLWHYGTTGETMPTPVVKHGRLYFATGSGHVHCINATTGQSIWNTALPGFDNMSSPTVLHGKVFVSMAEPGYLYCLNAQTGHIEWKVSVPGVVNTGMGDVSPAVADHIAVMDSIADPRTIHGKKTVNTVLFAVDTKTGKVIWKHLMGRGPLPPAFKGGVPMIDHHTIFVGSPTTSNYEAYTLKTGHLLWSLPIPLSGAAGAGRGAATEYQGMLYISSGPIVYAVNPANGQTLGADWIGGRFGIVNPVIVGGTMYLDNTWDWIIAVPLWKIYPGYRTSYNPVRMHKTPYNNPKRKGVHLNHMAP
ncbi:MAG: PQQ-like beta-propeller repeat protein, partial [Firmicutes bacterium]|nr:PQQ-like beta-propeller repeat protein [Bacillota bacterium]